MKDEEIPEIVFGTIFALLLFGGVGFGAYHVIPQMAEEYGWAMTIFGLAFSVSGTLALMFGLITKHSS